MRDILFRGKRIDTGEWVEGYYTYYPTGMDNSKETKTVIRDTSTSPGKLYFVSQDTICEYTGLEDKKGQKIWEGDIIKNTANIHWDLQEVKYGNCRNWILDGVRNKPFKASKCGCLISIEAQHIFEVIGNIFDNPELLN